MKQATLFLLLKEGQILLGMKKKGFGSGKFNGFGGKVEENEDAQTAAIRELKEESSITVLPEHTKKMAELTFKFPHAPEGKNWDQVVHVYIAKEWSGEPVESDEMAPQWFDTKELPFDKMWVDDQHWLPLVLQGKFVTGSFAFGKEDGTIEEKEIKTS